jgi:hypothetical protein
MGSRSQPEPVTCEDREPGMITDVSLRPLYLIFNPLLSWLQPCGAGQHGQAARLRSELEASWAAANNCLDTHGGNAFVDSYDVERSSTRPGCTRSPRSATTPSRALSRRRFSGCPARTEARRVSLLSVSSETTRGPSRLGRCPAAPRPR